MNRKNTKNKTKRREDVNPKTTKTKRPEDVSRKMIDPGNVDTNSRLYWQKVFQRMDEYSAVPYHKRLDVVEGVLKNQALVYRLRNIYDIHRHPDVVDFGKDFCSDTSLPESPTMNAVFVDCDPATFGTFADLLPEEDERLTTSQLNVPFGALLEGPQLIIDYRKELMHQADMPDEGDTMYLTFLKKPEAKANRWRPKPPISLTGMSLDAKCDEITRSIAEEFVEWMNNLGGATKSTLDVDGVRALFEIGFSCHAADSLQVCVQELNAVTEAVARARGAQEASYSMQLYRQLNRDMTAVRSKDANFAFGTTLPPEMRSGTTEDTAVAKWLENKRVPERLATMAVVWEGIEALKSTEGFCNYLKEHGDITPPVYLANKGMIENPAAGRLGVSSDTDLPKIDAKTFYAGTIAAKSGISGLELHRK